MDRVNIRLAVFEAAIVYEGNPKRLLQHRSVHID